MTDYIPASEERTEEISDALIESATKFVRHQTEELNIHPVSVVSLLAQYCATVLASLDRSVTERLLDWAVMRMFEDQGQHERTGFECTVALCKAYDDRKNKSKKRRKE